MSSESQVSVKVLINKAIYEKLKKESQLYQEHCLKKAQTSETVLQTGGGDCINDDEKVPVVPNLSSENTDQREAIVTEKCTELDGVTKVEVKEDEQKNDTEKLADSEILKYIWTRFKIKAAKLLKQFHNFPTRIDWDSSGIVTLNGEKYHDVKITDLLAISFYPVRTKKVLCLSIFIELLKELNLMMFVKNFEIRYEQ